MRKVLQCVLIIAALAIMGYAAWLFTHPASAGSERQAIEESLANAYIEDLLERKAAEHTGTVMTPEEAEEDLQENTEEGPTSEEGESGTSPEGTEEDASEGDGTTEAETETIADEEDQSTEEESKAAEEESEEDSEEESSEEESSSEAETSTASRIPEGSWDDPNYYVRNGVTYTPDYAIGELMGVLEIPTAGIRRGAYGGSWEAIVHDLDIWMVTVARPDYILGETHYCIYGHNHTVQDLSFNRLKDVRPKDVYTYTTEDGVYIYDVTRIFADWREQVTWDYVDNFTISPDKMYIITCGRGEYRYKDLVVEGTLRMVVPIDEFAEDPDYYMYELREEESTEEESSEEESSEGTSQEEAATEEITEASAEEETSEETSEKEDDTPADEQMASPSEAVSEEETSEEATQEEPAGNDAADTGMDDGQRRGFHVETMTAEEGAYGQEKELGKLKVTADDRKDDHGVLVGYFDSDGTAIPCDMALFDEDGLSVERWTQEDSDNNEGHRVGGLKENGIYVAAALTVKSSQYAMPEEYIFTYKVNSIKDGDGSEYMTEDGMPIWFKPAMLVMASVMLILLALLIKPSKKKERKG